MRWSAIVGLAVAASSAQACLWDSDTLAEEASLGKNYLATIVGRFPRNPPLYFEMRRARILAKSTKTLDDYDDLAVACDRLNDPVQGLKWLDRKPHGDSTFEYRTHANRGTLLVHAALQGKLGREAMVRGLAELKKAVGINPNAHFGREYVQINLIEGMLAKREDYPADVDPLRGAEGLAGIIRLGKGWESPDVFRALAVDLAAKRLGAMARMAILRAEELDRSGKKGQLDPMIDRMTEGTQWEPLEQDTKEQYVRLRREADVWASRRTAFMMERLRAGRHPDTDQRFWDGWNDGPRMTITRSWILDTFGMPVPWWALAIGGLVSAACTIGPLAGLFFIGRKIVRRAKLKGS